ncbi:class I SAM-dependent methyltransferase, partial [Streptomyces sp. NPDC005056]
RGWGGAPPPPPPPPPTRTVTSSPAAPRAPPPPPPTFRANLGTDVVADFLVGDGMADVPPGSVDLVLNNPPFHSHQATTDATARTMFHGARTALRQGGELWVVGNRHLGYHTQLRRTFGNCTTVAGDPKFVVLRAVKR